MMLRRLLFIASVMCGATIMAANGWAQAPPPSSKSKKDSNANSIAAFVAGPSTAGAVRQGATRGIGGGQNVFRGTLAAISTGARGFSAGDESPRLGVWANVSATWFDENQEALDSDGSVTTGLAGADYRINDWFLAGLSVGYERQDVTTEFNQGSVISNGYVLAPYVMVQLIPDRLFLDVSGGYAGMGQTIERTSGTRLVSGTPDAARVFASGALQANFEHDKWRLRPETGVLWLDQHVDGYLENSGLYIPSSNSPLGRFHAGARISYSLGRVEPYVSGEFEYDFKTSTTTADAGLPQPSTRRTGGLVGTGLLFQATPGLFGGIQFSTSVGRADYSQYSLGGTLRYAF